MEGVFNNVPDGPPFLFPVSSVMHVITLIKLIDAMMWKSPVVE